MVAQLQSVAYELPYCYVTDEYITWAWMATHGRRVTFSFSKDEHKVHITTVIKPLSAHHLRQVEQLAHASRIEKIVPPNGTGTMIVELPLPDDAVFLGAHRVIPQNDKFYGIMLQKKCNDITEKVTGQDWSESDDVGDDSPWPDFLTSAGLTTAARPEEDEPRNETDLAL